MDPNNGYIGGDQNAGRGIAPPRGNALSGKIMMSVMVVLFAVVLLILFLHLYIRWHLLRLSSRRARHRRRLRHHLVFSGEAHGPEARGLDPDALKSLPVLVYSASDGGGGADDAAECAVCLNEFEEEEKLRNLPQCGHRFHIECIDMWFHSHASCPLCRSAVEPEKSSATAAVNTVLIQVSDAPPTPAAACSSATDLCSSCRSESGIGSSSSTSDELELMMDSLKPPGDRIRAIRRLLSCDLKLHLDGGSVEEPDLEAERAPPTPPAQLR